MQMMITIQPLANDTLETGRELQRAFHVLHDALIQTRGGGRFAHTSAAIILARETDGPAALAELERAGIPAVTT